MHDKEPVIQIRDLKKFYERETPVLKGINLDIYRGQIIGYIGPNGAGKTTTVKILTGILPGFMGAVNVLGYDMAESPVEVKKRTGFVPENGALYDLLTPVEYLDFVGRLHGLKKDTITARTGELLDVFGLGGKKSQRMTTFSKGMKQKVLIIAGLLHNPEILFLDEPLAGLDANTAIIIKEILAGLAAKGKTVFYCSHIMDVVERISHRIVIINKGEIVADGPFEELQARAVAHPGETAGNNSNGKSQTLENIFTSLTGSHEYKAAADRFIAALSVGESEDERK